MIKSHKRNTSEFTKRNNRKRVQNQQQQHHISNKKPKSKIYTLVEKSSATIPHKKVVIEELQEDYNNYQENQNNGFFNFGRKVSMPKKWHLGVNKITQAQDSNSHRQVTSYRSQIDNKSFYNSYHPESQDSTSQDNYLKMMNKQNQWRGNQSIVNTSLQHKKPKKTSTKKTKKMSKRQNCGNIMIKDERITKNSKVKSTTQLHKKNNSRDNKQKDFDCSNESYHKNIQRTEKIQKSMKMLWQCMGQLWENTRVSHYKSEKNTQSLIDIRRMIQDQQNKILQMKFELSKVQNGQKTGLRF